MNMESELESMIDSYGLSRVLEALASVASDKAEHIRSSYQDEPLAKLWDKSATACRKVAQQQCILALPS